MKLNEGLTAASAEDDLSWIVDGVRPFADGVVGTLVPVGFAAYGRIFHPAWRGGRSPIRWDAVAAWSGRTVHGLAEFTKVASPVGQPADPAPYDQRPRDGELPQAAIHSLARVLRNHTGTPDQWFVGIWEGVGWMDRSEAKAPLLCLPERTHLVFKGNADILDKVGWIGFDGRPVHEAPNLIWPADRAWLVATDVDQESTYVGGSAALVAALIADPALEVWPASATDPVTAGSDTINR